MYSETFLASAKCSAGSFSPEIDSSASGNTKGEGCHPGWSLPPRRLMLVNTIHEIGYLLAVTRGHMQLSWIAFTRGSEQPGAATPFVWRTVSRAQPEGSPEPRSLQGRYISPNEKCGGIAGGPTVRGVRSRSGTGRGGKIRSTGFDSTTTTGFASFGKRQLFLLETTLFSPFCRRISVLFSLNKSVVFHVFWQK